MLVATIVVIGAVASSSDQLIARNQLCGKGTVKLKFLYLSFRDAKPSQGDRDRGRDRNKI